MYDIDDESEDGQDYEVVTHSEFAEALRTEQVVYRGLPAKQSESPSGRNRRRTLLVNLIIIILCFFII